MQARPRCCDLTPKLLDGDVEDARSHGKVALTPIEQRAACRGYSD